MGPGWLRHEPLDREVSTTLLEAKVLVDGYRKEYKRIRRPSRSWSLMESVDQASFGSVATAHRRPLYPLHVGSPGKIECGSVVWASK